MKNIISFVDLIQRWILTFYFLTIPVDSFAFGKLKNGFETITSSYLIPLSHAVAGAGFIYFVMMSIFKPEENLKKAGNVVVLAIFLGAGLEIINKVIQTFS